MKQGAVKAIFIVLAVWLVAITAFAVPACPDTREIEQPDGIRFHLKLHGDEFFSWTETTNGYAVVKDKADGFWKFARPASKQASFVVMPGARVGSSNPAAYGLKKNDMPDVDALREHIKERRRTVRGKPVDATAPSAAAPSGVSASEPTEPPPEQPPAGIPVSGTKTIRNIVILASFSDHWDSGADTVLSAKGRINAGEYSNLFNEVDHTSDGAVGSVRDYYDEVSYGKLTIESVVVPWVVLPQNEAYYGANVGGSDDNPKQMIWDAIDAAEAAGFDFSQGDSDGDGWVDCLTIIHSGHGEEYSGNPADSIWSHKWTLTSIATKDGVKMYRYHTEPALRGSTASTGIIRVGVICHEMGHFFGLPDLYDYSSTTYGVGRWGVMASGSWNGSDGRRPAHFCAWSKSMLGFLNPEPVHSQSGLSLARVEDHPEVKLLRDGMSNGEYFLIENRAKVGFDNDSTIYPGMLIYHVDSKSVNNDLGTWDHPVVKIEEADGDNSLGAKTASSESGDVWTSANGLVGGFHDQTGVQSVNSMLYQASDYNRIDNASSYSFNLLSNFSAAASTMTCDLRSLKTTVDNQAANSPNYTVSWPACSQATQYEIQEGAKTVLTGFSDGAEDEATMYENWHLTGTVQRDAGGAQAGSYSYAMHQYYGGIWHSSMQSMTMRKAFQIKTDTVLSFYFMSHLASGNGYLECQISSDNGGVWATLGTYNGYVNTWALRSYNYAEMNALGINSGDMCIVRFIASFEYTSGWSAFPGYGFALDSIAITDTGIDGYSDWATLNSNVTGTSYDVSEKTDGVYAYRVRSYANGTWQEYGTEGEVAVDAFPSVTINQAAGQADPTNSSPINFTVVFSESVADFTTGDVTITGTAPGAKTGTVTGAGTTYNVAVSGMTNSGTVIATIATNKAHDAVGNGNTVSTSTDNIVTYVADADSDGIPNDWETLYYGGATNAVAGATCSNGVNTVLEAYVAGLDPTDPTAAFVMTQLGSDAGNAERYVLQWPLVTGRVYTIYWASNLLSGFDVTPLATNIAAGAFTDTVHGADVDGFYRIEVDLAP